MSLTDKINYLEILRRNFNNWLSIGLYLYRGKWSLPSNKKFLVVLRDHTEIKLWGLEIYFLYSLLKKGIHINDALDYVINNKIPFKNEFGVEYNVLIQGWCNEGNINNGNIFDVFLSEEYSFLNVFEMDVIDVGASIGDSPIYFALRGAKRVIALEPFPYSYSFAELNVKKNNLTNKIEILNAGYGEDGFVIIDPDKKSFDYTELSNSDKGMKIPLYSLKTLIAQYQVHEAVLKMDCEGCEYNILKENNEILRKFKQIQIEYHYGYVELKNKLMNAGFDVRYTQPHKFYDRRKEINPNMELGYVYAVRMD